MKYILIFIITFIFLVKANTPIKVEGKWFNSLGSHLTLERNGSLLTGWYNSTVGHVVGNYPITGWIDIGENIYHSIGWTVLWKNKEETSNSITAWVGTFEETIINSWWILKIGSSSWNPSWNSTMMGINTFTRIW